MDRCFEHVSVRKVAQVFRAADLNGDCSCTHHWAISTVQSLMSGQTRGGQPEQLTCGGWRVLRIVLMPVMHQRVGTTSLGDDRLDIDEYEALVRKAMPE